MDASDAEVAFYVAEADRVTKAPDVAEVKEAIEYWDEARFGLTAMLIDNDLHPPQEIWNAIDSAMAAARRWVRVVSEGEELTWCEPHDSPLIHDSEVCDYALENEWCVTPCRADGSRLVAAVGVEKEEL